MGYKIKGKEYTDQEAYDKFIEDFCGLIETYKSYEVSDDALIPCFYGNIMAQSDRDPMRDADVVESDLYDEGWTDENLKKLFTQFREDLMNDLNSESRGGFDVFLYNWTNGEFPLGGIELDSRNHEELLIKYSYGWNKTKYGRLLLKQNNLLDNFTELVANSYKEETLTNHINYLMSPGNLANNYIPNDKRKNIFKKINQFIKVDKNVITVKYKKIVDTINLIMFINFDNIPEEMYNYLEFVQELKNETNSELSRSGHSLNIHIDTPNDDDLVIAIN
jgi:hypothetical protein